MTWEVEPHGGDIIIKMTPCPKKHYWTRLRAWVTRREFFHACDVTWVSVIEGTLSAEPPTFTEGTISVQPPTFVEGTIPPSVVSIEGVLVVPDDPDE